jgi:hypothetical protein
MEINLESIVILLLTQAMINLGEVKNPIEKNIKLNLKGAQIFIELLKVLKVKTQGNLTDEESSYLNEALDNIEHIYKKKISKKDN